MIDRGRVWQPDTAHQDPLDAPTQDWPRVWIWLRTGQVLRFA
jgi:hypothetical protein